MNHTNLVRLNFVLNSMFASGLLMFLCMGTGEILVDPNLFGGFLKDTGTWSMIFLESAIAALPVSLLGMMILQKTNPQTRKGFVYTSAGIWLVLGLVVVILYKIFYWPREWQFTSLEPGLLFGWLIPCALIWLTMTCLSLPLFKPVVRG